MRWFLPNYSVLRSPSPVAAGNGRAVDISRLRSTVACGLVIGLLSFAPTAALGSEPKWPVGPYRYLIIDQDAQDALREFGRNIKIPVKIGPEVAGRRIRGSMPELSAKDFLKRVCDSYGLVWYFDGAVLHISAESEVRTEVLDTGPLKFVSILRKLDALGLSDPRYTLRATRDAGVLSVSGPPSYRALVKQTIEAMGKSVAPPVVQEVPNGDEVKVRVFRGNSSGS
jgi:type II secretory pathway component GspD/PulD (secretin)